MKFSVDRIEENIAVVQNLDTKEIIQLPKGNLPKNIKDGSIIKLENGEYKFDEKTQEEREQIIREKMRRLKAIKKAGSESDEQK